MRSDTTGMPPVKRQEIDAERDRAVRRILELLREVTE